MLLLLTEDTVFPPVVFSSAFLKSPASFSVSYCFPDTLNHAYKWPLIYNPDFAYQRENGDFFFFFLALFCLISPSIPSFSIWKHPLSYWNRNKPSLFNFPSRELKTVQLLNGLKQSIPLRNRLLTCGDLPRVVWRRGEGILGNPVVLWRSPLPRCWMFSQKLQGWFSRLFTWQTT